MVGARTFSASVAARAAREGQPLSALRLLCGPGRAPQAPLYGGSRELSVRGGLIWSLDGWHASVLQPLASSRFWLQNLAICSRAHEHSRQYFTVNAFAAALQATGRGPT
jgi:hypothetical protein